MSKIRFIPASAEPGAPMGGWTFEWINRNLSGYDYTFTYTGNKINTKAYDLGGGLTITVTYGYTGNNITSLTLSGDTPFGITLVKTLGYTGNKLTSGTYS